MLLQVSVSCLYNCKTSRQSLLTSVSFPPQVDFAQLRDDDDDDDDDDIASQVDTSDAEYPEIWRQDDDADYQHLLCNSSLAAYDLATERSQFVLNARRHTLGVIEQPWGSYSVPQSRPGSRQSCTSSEAESIAPEDVQVFKARLTADGRQWPDGMSLADRLSLTLEEIIHIRSVFWFVRFCFCKSMADPAGMLNDNGGFQKRI